MSEGPLGLLWLVSSLAQLVGCGCLSVGSDALSSAVSGKSVASDLRSLSVASCLSGAVVRLEGLCMCLALRRRLFVGLVSGTALRALITRPNGQSMVPALLIQVLEAGKAKWLRKTRTIMFTCCGLRCRAAQSSLFVRQSHAQEPCCPRCRLRFSGST